MPKITAKEFRTKIMCCTHDDEVWDLVKLMCFIGDDETKELACTIKGMDVDEAQAYLEQNP